MRKLISKRLDKSDVRQVCINHNYYTAGTCEEYAEMFKMLDYETPLAKHNITPYRLQLIATDIKEHSVTNDTVEDIMENLVVHIRCCLVDEEE